LINGKLKRLNHQKRRRRDKFTKKKKVQNVLRRDMEGHWVVVKKQSEG